MATFDISPLFRSTAMSFERPWEHWSNALSGESSGYPAYNILKLNDDEYRLSIAVPGMSAQEISVESRENSVWVKGEREVDPNHNQYLHRGFGVQGFSRTFELPEHVRVKGATLKMGVLNIDLVRELPESMRPRRIEIQSDTHTQPVLQDSSRAA